MTKLDVLIGSLGALASFGAGAFWLRASLIAVPDSMDTFIGELQRIGRVNAWGAWSACAAAMCGAYAFGRTAGWL